MPHPLDAAQMLRERWRSAETTYGAWVYIPNSFSAEIEARAGFDWACIDMQHGMTRSDDLVALLQVFALTNSASIVRVPSNDPAVIMRALDAGASGVIVPMVNSAADAENAVAACRYPPLGRRSWGPARAAFGTSEYSPAWANERVLCVVMIETPEGIDNVEEIVAVPGVDAVFIGPADLALSFGVERADRENVDRIGAIKAVCDRQRVPAGIATSSAAEARQACTDGFAMVALPSDAVLLARCCAAVLADVRATVPDTA